MNNLFYVMGCGFCREMKKSAIPFNFTAPIGEKIDFIDIHKGDSRLAIIDKIYNGPSLALPTTTFDFTKHTSQFGIDVEKPILRIVIKSSTTTSYSINFLRFLNNNYLSPY